MNTKQEKMRLKKIRDKDKMYVDLAWYLLNHIKHDLVFAHPSVTM